MLVDDDDEFRGIMSSELARRGYAVSSVASGAAALAQAGEADVIVLDLRLPDMDGIEVLKRLRTNDVPAGVLMLTGHGTIDTAIQAVRLGAYDYLEKPCPLDRMDMAIQKAYEHLRLVERQRVLEDGYSAVDVGLEFIGKSPALEKVRQTIARVAPTDSTTLILGETGVGKEMVARSLHALSRRRERPFVVVDCAALHEQLLQSELFGHEKGAFTSSDRLKHGLFEVGNTGTIFLDEVGEMSPEVQAKLLRVLETGRFRRLGGTKEIVVDVRVISATNRDLNGAIARGHFREDLYFRLALLTVEVPPLRERRDDIGALVEHFTHEFNLRFSRSQRFAPATIEALRRYRWPGNVRELIHAVQQSMVLTDRDVIEPEDLPAAITLGGTDSTPRAGETLSLRDVQRRHVLSVMERVGGNRAQASRILHISERTLYRLLRRYARPAGPAGGAGGGTAS
ncbi:MAG: sigma-54-dependent Fis family transcriptional regulator [Deltaproteobacteria bacterium]|nr:sigma-54-dependent Fis family transcriptional regulator [Deltaproteobacteria bacterium]